MENASRRYSYQDVKKMIERMKEERHWEFLYLGANINAAAEASRFGIDADRAVTFTNDADGVPLNYREVSETVTRFRAGKAMGGWKDRIEKDHRSRKH